MTAVDETWIDDDEAEADIVEWYEARPVTLSTAAATGSVVGASVVEPLMPSVTPLVVTGSPVVVVASTVVPVVGVPVLLPASVAAPVLEPSAVVSSDLPQATRVSSAAKVADKRR